MYYTASYMLSAARMGRTLECLLLICTWLYLTQAVAGSVSQRPLSLGLDVDVRLAGPNDARAIAEVLIDAFADSPHIKYVYQHANDSNREVTLQCGTLSVAESLSHPNIYAHIGVLHTEDGDKVVSASAWEAPWTTGTPLSAGLLSLLGHGRSFLELDCPGPAVNMTRAIHCGTLLSQAEQRLLDDVYGNHQLYLAAIGTLPKYQGHDIAGMLLREGIKHGMARVPESNGLLYATLLATPAGEPLYFENHYRSIENVSIPSIEGDQHFRFDAMDKVLRVP